MSYGLRINLVVPLLILTFVFRANEIVKYDSGDHWAPVIIIKVSVLCSENDGFWFILDWKGIFSEFLLALLKLRRLIDALNWYVEIKFNGMHRICIVHTLVLPIFDINGHSFHAITIESIEQECLMRLWGVTVRAVHSGTDNMNIIKKDILWHVN